MVDQPRKLDAGETRWRAASPLAPPLTVAAATAPRQVSGLPVRRAAFASPNAGWVVVGTTADHRLLYTDDAGATWRAQLAWWGDLHGDVLAFDERQALLKAVLDPRRPDVNGQPAALAQYLGVFAGTVDAGETWTLGYPPDRHGNLFDALSPRRMWQMVGVPGQYPRSDLVRTGDGGASWQHLDGPGDIVRIRVAFESERDGLLVAAVLHRADELYATGDGGSSWTRVPVPAPPRVPKTAETWLTPLLRPAPGMLLLTAFPRRAGPLPEWTGAYLYRRAGADLSAWSGPYRLPRPADERWNGVVARGVDGRIWTGSGHELWVEDEPGGGWRPVPVPVDAGQSIKSLAAVGDGVLWLSTEGYVPPGLTFSGRLYHSPDEGESWVEVPVGTP